ncbi:MAG: thiamine phosphate synthase [Tepidisphaeraceae bacterium]
MLRVLDANANRAREALRVVEDYARFVLNDVGLCSGLKSLRHELSGAARDVFERGVFVRDIAEDVGTAVKTDSELQRSDASAVVTAAGKRLGEALRSIEEFLKIIDPDASRKVESIRYRFYEIEKELALRLRPAARAFAQVLLYVLISESLCKRGWLETAEQAILGGADCLQLREKNLERGELLIRARKLVELCRRHHVHCIINDHAEIAVLSDADGAHLGQQDLPPREARKLLGPRIIGVSTHNLDQAKQAASAGADYIGVGPIFRSATKPRDFLPGLALAKQVAGTISIPAVAIAGITAQNVDELLGTGIRAVAVSSAVISADDPRAAAKSLKDRLTRK